MKKTAIFVMLVGCLFVANVYNVFSLRQHMEFRHDNKPIFHFALTEAGSEEYTFMFNRIFYYQCSYFQWKQGNRHSVWVLFSDSFGNLITNIHSSILSKKVAYVEIKGRKLPFLPTYGIAGKGEPLALIGSFDYLEIAIREGSAKDFFEGEAGTKVVVHLEE